MEWREEEKEKKFRGGEQDRDEGTRYFVELVFHTCFFDFY